MANVFEENVLNLQRVEPKRDWCAEKAGHGLIFLIGCAKKMGIAVLINTFESSVILVSISVIWVRV